MPLSHALLRPLVLIAGAAAMAITVTGPAAAKESAGTVQTTLPPPTASSTCSPVHDFRTSSDTRVGDTGMASISVDYSVKPCDSKQTVTVQVHVNEEFDPATMLWDDTAAPLSDKFDIVGVQPGTWYRVTLTARDADTGATVGGVSRLTLAPVPTKA